MNTSHTNRDALIQQLFENVSAMKRSMASHWQLTNHDCPVSQAQLELLFTIRHMQPVSFKQIAAHLHLTPGAVSQLVEGLEQHQLVNRQADPHDRRVQCLELSQNGTVLLRGIEQRRRSLMQAIAEDLSDEELELWLRVQTKILNHFQTEPTKKPAAKENA